MSAVRWVLVLAPVALLGGCSCNEQELVFPEPDPVESDEPTSIGSWLSFDTSPEGARLTMSYYDRDLGAVGFAVGTPAEDGTVAWVHEEVDGYPEDNGLDPGDYGKYADHEVAPDGTVWIAYYDGKLGGLRVAHRKGPKDWEEATTVDGGTGLPGTGKWASVAVDADGHVTVAHVDEASAAVRVSRFDGSSWSTTQAYVSQPVDATDADGYPIQIPAGVAYTSVLRVGDVEYIAFQDTASGDLHLLTDMSDEIVDADGDVGAWPSLWSDGTKLRIAYQDEGNQDLLLATRQSPSASWSIETVDDGAMRGADTAVFDMNGEPAIVYFDGMDNDAWLASRAGGSWALERLGGESGAVGFHNEVVFAAGRFWAGSYDYSADGLFLKAL